MYKSFYIIDLVHKICRNITKKMATLFCPKKYAMFRNVCKINFQILRYGRFCTQILGELETLTTASSTLCLCELDSETLASDTR